MRRGGDAPASPPAFRKSLLLCRHPFLQRRATSHCTLSMSSSRVFSSACSGAGMRTSSRAAKYGAPLCHLLDLVPTSSTAKRASFRGNSHTCSSSATRCACHPSTPPTPPKMAITPLNLHPRRNARPLSHGQQSRIKQLRGPRLALVDSGPPVVHAKVAPLQRLRHVHQHL
jgi:hypothetical protein